MRVRVVEMSQAAEARRTAASVATELGLSETDTGRVALVASEAATNVVKHGKGGEVLVSALKEGDASGVQILSIDSGPGIPDVAAAMRDGHSTAGSPGTGLGAIQRLANSFDISSQPGLGTIVFAQVWEKNYSAAPGLEIGGVCEALAGESVSGDAWAAHRFGSRTSFIVADGLGHGVGAAEASRAALDIFGENAALAPARLLEMVHNGLRNTRGAAVAVAMVDTEANQVCFAGLGNVTGFVFSSGSSRALLSLNGTAGHEARKIQQFNYPWNPDSTLLLHSDGLATHWHLGDYAGVLGRHPAILAATLYRDHSRQRDDITVVAASPRRLR